MPQLHALVVDDNHASTTIIQKMLEKIDIVSDTAASTHEATCLLTENKYDLVITDLFMADATGADLARKINNISEAIPIIVVTACDIRAAQAACEGISIAAIIVKPITRNALYEALQIAKIIS